MASAAFNVPITGTFWMTLLDRYLVMMVRFGAPIARAASTYVASFALTVVLRTTRKYCGMYMTVMAMAAAVIPPPSRSENRNENTIAINRDGNAYSASMISTRKI